MKNFIFLSAMAVAALSANAQAVESGLKAQPIGFQKTFAKMNVKGGELAPRLEGARTPMRAIADDAQAAIVNGVFYQRPEGCYYSAYTWGSADGSSLSGLLVPTLAPVTYLNACANPAAASWTINGQDASELADADNNFVITWGVNTTDQIVGAMYAPTISVGATSFTCPPLSIGASGVSPQMTCNPAAVKLYSGFNDGPAFGTGSVLEANIEGETGGKCTAIYDVYEKPAAPMYVESFDVPFFSSLADPLGGKTLTMEIYGFNEEGKLEANPRHVLTCSTVDDLDSYNDPETGETIYYGTAVFTQNVENEFGDLVAEPFVLDYAYATILSGYKEQGVDVQFRMCYTGEDIYELMFATPTRLVTEVDGETRYYYFGNDSGAYKMNVFVNCFYDDIDYPEFYNSLVASNDGQTLETDSPNLAEENRVNFVPVYTAAPVIETDENGEPVGSNYDIVDCPDWVTLTVDDSTRGQYGYSIIVPEVEPLPAGVEGRAAFIYLEGRGVKSKKPLVIRQGNVVGINNVETEHSANVIRYNVAGQRVNNAKGLVISKNGKELVK